MTNRPSLPPVTAEDVTAYLNGYDDVRGKCEKYDARTRAGLNAYRARLIANGHATEPTTPAPLLVLPTVDEIAPVIWADIKGDALAEEWARIGETGQRYWRKAAACVLAHIATLPPLAPKETP